MRDTARLDKPSASKFYLVSNCPGQHNLEMSLPPDKLVRSDPENDKLAASGTRIHRARETGNTLELDAEEDALYQSGLKLEQALLDNWLELYQLTECFEGQPEERLWLHHPHTLEPMCSGQLDVHFLDREKEPTNANITDWKTAFCTNLGRARGNAQLRLQAVLLWKDHPTLKNIRVSFVKNRFEKAKLDYADYSEMDLKYSEQSIMFDLWNAQQEEAPRRAGPHCNFCPCKAWCPEAGAYLLIPSVIAAQTIAKIDATEEERVELLAPVDVKRIWQASTVTRKILDACSARLKGMSEEELKDIGMGLKDGRKIPEVTKPKELFAHLQNELHWPDDDIWKCITFVLGAVAEEARGKQGIASKKLASEWVKEKLAEFIEINETAKLLEEI